MRNYGLIGRSLTHSFSQRYFSAKFDKEKLEAQYHNFEIETIEDFPKLLQDNKLEGLNVTIPYKESIIPFLDDVDEVAHKVGAVNTVVFQNGKTKGYNTDVIGFKNSIKPFLKHGQERALILGTGGASKAVAYVLGNLGIDVLFLSRNPDQKNHYSYQEANEHMLDACKIIVNTTPLGTAPETDQCPDIPYDFLTEDHLCYDLVYNPPETLFMKHAKSKGATTVNGLSMLKIQAEEAWKLWSDSAS